mmetsp:Transcript_1532/g.1743  ORF Transcript_1532/g.1743 Transcript_1532/m.1743 type:complete len:655 (-) Transcript_1532:50-2014(-)
MVLQICDSNDVNERLLKEAREESIVMGCSSTLNRASVKKGNNNWLNNDCTPSSAVPCLPLDYYDNVCMPLSPREVVSEPFFKAYQNGTLCSYFWGKRVKGRWSGHLPLGPAYPTTTQSECPRSKRHLKRRRDSNINIVLPENQNREKFHRQEEQQAPASTNSIAKMATKHGSTSMRQAPNVVNSMSIPAGSQLQANSMQASLGSHHSPGSGLSSVMIKQPGTDRSALKELPALRDAPFAKREELFVMKLKLCSVIFSFDDPTADKRGKDMKRQTLLELVNYVNTPAGQKIFTESVMSDLMICIHANVCRALPPANDDFDAEEDEPALEPAWPHLQVAYEFFLRFIVSSEVNTKAAKKYVNQKFCLQLVELFDSGDPRERDYLKTILHRIYGKFMSHRSLIRRAISNEFYRFVYETENHNGIGELLEILGSIINGFAIPLKKEHLQFLVRALIPLHKPKCVALYHQQLSYCVIQYIEKDTDTAAPILNGFFKCWPWCSSSKQIMFLNELEEILELLGADQLAQVNTMLFTNLARCLDSDHFQVVERALFLWNNEHLVNSGCLSRLNAQTVLPLIYGPLYKNSSGHWNATVEGLAQNVLKMYMEYDLVLYDKCTAAYFREEEEAKLKLETIVNRWDAIEEEAMAKKQYQLDLDIRA